MSALKPLLRSFQALFRVLTVDLPQGVFRAIARAARPGRSGTQSGFILPTVVMVILVVTLVVAAILARSFDRAKNASNYRVNQLTLSAAAPALDRARAKLDAAFNDPTLPRGTPSDLSINQVLTRDGYNLPDEVRLRVAFDFRNNADPPTFKGDGAIDRTQTILPNQEFMTTAWRFPVDTDNNGRFDSFTLYGIYFRSPSRDKAGGFARERTPLDARTPPQDDGSSTSAACAAAQGTSASLVGADGWFKSGALLKKSFYVYTATVPITDLSEAGLLGSPENPTAPLPPDQYEVFRGNRGFTALEYQQDRARIPLGNNAIVYEDDLDLYSGTPLRINGRIVTNSNLLATDDKNIGGATTTSDLRLYQVSSDESCFYEAENAKIIVGGNVINRSLFGEAGASPVVVDLFNGLGKDPTEKTIDDTRESVTNSGPEAAYNTLAYEERINLLVNAALNRNTFSVNGTYPNFKVSGNDPKAVRDRIEERINAEVNPADPGRARREELEVWFRNRTRRVPFSEVPFGADRATVVLDNFTEATVLQDQGGDNLRPPDAWIYPADPNSGNTKGFTELSLVADQLEATDPDQLDEREVLLGDRIAVGNGLPANWFNPDTGEFADADTQQEVRPATAWTAPAGAPNRYRSTQVRELVDVGLTDRDGFWETNAAAQPKNRLDAIGGLRIVTGAGIYRPANDEIPSPTTPKVVWPDTWPQPPNPKYLPSEDLLNHPNYRRIFYDPDGNGSIPIDDDTPPNNTRNTRPYLKMRATAVYHYAYDDDNDPKTPAPPIACVSSFYDPTTANTAKNNPTLVPGIDVSGALANGGTLPPGTGYSNNGVTYGPPGPPTVDDQLRYQSNLVYPNGRLVNPMLKKAIEKLDRGGPLTLAERAAIDSTRCGLRILDGSLTPTTTPTAGFTLPHGTIQEVSFLDAREVKETDTAYNHQPETKGTTAPFDYNSGNEPNDDSPIEQRQPLEVRVTAINLDNLRRQTAPSIATGPQTEWMLPDSGIIFASRDDALPDLSALEARNPNTADDPDTPYYNEADPLVNQALWEVDPDRVSGTDYWLDPTRRPNGIMLFNGLRLARGDDNSFTKSGVADGEEEKGLTLATNLPVYIQAEANASGNPGFNVHTQEEFTAALDQATWNNFYTRTAAQLNSDFACRAGDPRLNCPTGDQWRAAAVLGDSLTLLSTDFRPGFRNEGGYDLRNNQTDNLFRNITTAGYFNSNLHTAFGIQPPAQLFKGTPLPGNGIDTIEERRLRVGFWNNEFAINGLSSNNLAAFGPGYTDATYSQDTAQAKVLNSSYFNNFVTPVQRRRDGALEFLMEACNKLPLSECTPNDWYIRLPANPATSPPNPNEKASNTLDQVNPVIKATPGDAGTTAAPPSFQLPNNQVTVTAARRVAFLRVTQHFRDSRYTLVNSPTNIATANVDDLILDSSNFPVLLGIDSGGNVECYTYSTTPVEIRDPSGSPIHTCQSFSSALPRTSANALWFRTAQDLNNPYNKSGDEQYTQFGTHPPYIVNPTSARHRSGYLEVLGVDFAADPQQQPMLHPVLQLHSGDDRRPNEAFGGSSCGGPEYCSHWQPRAAGDATNGSEFNLLMAVGDSPSRNGPFGPDGDFNGAVSSLPRVLENWDPLGNQANSTPITIRGSFIQLKRTNYATAPFWHIKASPQGNNGTGSLLRYSQRYASNAGRNNSYNAPGRFWGFDVGLLSQFPDLFSQRFTLPPTDDPNEYYREVNRSDDWIEALLCAQNVDPTNPPNSGGRNAVNATQRPNGCLQ